MPESLPLRVTYDAVTHEKRIERGATLRPLSPQLFGYLHALTHVLPDVAAVSQWRSEPAGQEDCRCHELFHELVLVVDGRAEYEINGTNVTVGPDDALLLKPVDIHRYLPGKPFEAITMHARFDTLDIAGGQVEGLTPGEATDRFYRFLTEYYPTHHVLRLANAGTVHAHASAMAREYRMPGPASRLLVSARFVELLVLLARGALFGPRAGSDGGPDEARHRMLVDYVTSFIDEHFAEDIDTGTIFANFPLHPNYCRNIFKEIAGVPVTTYLLQRRMAAARELLLN
ncbi:MAG: hypothetical protein GF331_22770, partial [Chitinivibrionales bacterium]|nr:hypothetical protein [Chitinivibrionales bacterium]